MKEEVMSTESGPMVSVLMTAYNREQYIAEAMEAVLASAYKNLELIVVDDRSKDGTVAIARHYEQTDQRVRVFVNEVNLGDYPNRNKAASYARGEYIKYVDSDDIMFPFCIKRMMERMLQCPDAGYGLCAVMDDQTQLCTSPRESYLEHFRGRGHFDRSPGGSIIKKEAFDAVGGFTGMRQLGDFEFWLKIGAYYPMVKLPFDVIWMRSHEGQESKVNTEAEKNRMRVQVLKSVFSQEKVPLDEKERSAILRWMDTGIRAKLARNLSGVSHPSI